MNLVTITILIGLFFNLFMDLFLIAALFNLTIKKGLITIRPIVGPILWITLLLVSISSLFYFQPYNGILIILILLPLFLNSIFMSFILNPYLIVRKKKGVELTDVGFKWHVRTGFVFGSAFISWVYLLLLTR